MRWLILIGVLAGVARADVTINRGPLAGVTVAPLTPEIAAEVGHGGVLVVDVDRFSLAADMLQRGDVVYEVNGQKIDDEADFQRVARSKLPSRGVPIRLRRP
jgi:S1-C subfamily serine protease